MASPGAEDYNAQSGFVIPAVCFLLDLILQIPVARGDCHCDGNYQCAAVRVPLKCGEQYEPQRRREALVDMSRLQQAFPKSRR